MNKTTTRKDSGLLVLQVCAFLIIATMIFITVMFAIVGNHLIACANTLIITSSAINFIGLSGEYRTGKPMSKIWTARAVYLMLSGIILGLIGIYMPLS